MSLPNYTKRTDDRDIINLYNKIMVVLPILRVVFPASIPP